MHYAIVDIETTGGHASSHGITEISVFVHDGKRVVKHFETGQFNPVEIQHYAQQFDISVFRQKMAEVIFPYSNS